MSVPSNIIRRMTNESSPIYDDFCKICHSWLDEGDSGYKGRLCRNCSPAVRQAKRYGLSVPHVNAILRVQGDCCPLCDDGPGDDALYGPIWWNIDHDHKCCKGCPSCVRGLLCSPCNTRLGYYEKRLSQSRASWPSPVVDAYLARPPAQRPEAKELHSDDRNWARVRYIGVNGPWQGLTWKA
ncbi:endonuclease domain-containing protein [Streptomyces polyrhachis]|uniref:Endonuclease domain-containing protein n=1 Tax=Streptomyces polyrhachis TaxID=1282885 RepID=A0ABW2GI36_9ACTN